MTTARASACPVLDFDHHAPINSHDRDTVIRQVRDHPVFYTEANGGHWVITSFPLAKKVLADSRTFTGAKSADGGGGVSIPSVGWQLLPSEAPDERHRVLRRSLDWMFNKTAVEALRPFVEDTVRRTLDRVIEQGEFDVVHDLAAGIPPAVITHYVGFSDEERGYFIESVAAALSQLDMSDSGGDAPDGPSHQGSADAFADASRRLGELIERRRAEPADDLTSRLIKDTDLALSDLELFSLLFTTMAGGIENPVAMISNALYELGRDTELRAQLIADPDLIPAAIDEIYRWVTPAVAAARTATREVEIGGVTIAEGDRVLVWYPAANHDPNVFTDPERFDIHRANNRQHLGLGAGSHFCFGFLLARVEMEVTLREVLTRIPDYVIDTDNSHRMPDAATMYSWQTMPARTTPNDGTETP